MSRARSLSALALLFLISSVAAAQSRGGGRGRANPSIPTDLATPPPELPGPELEGPPPPEEFQQIFKLTDEQAAKYAAARDSFMTATQMQRDSAHAAQARMHEAQQARKASVAQSERARLMDHDRPLKKAQAQFDNLVLKSLLTKEQAADYKEFRKKQEELAKARRPGPGAQ